MSIECAFFGFLAADAESRTSKAGNLWARLRVGVGKDDAMQWVSVAVFGKAAETAAGLRKGDRIYEGEIKLDSWRGADGTEKNSLSVSSFKIEKTHQIGRNKPPKQDKPASGQSATTRSMHASLGNGAAGLPDDDIPFAAEFR
jgi:single-stranded DNA-binding protein